MTSGVALLREIVESCTESERKIAEYLIAHPKTAVFCTIAELAKQADTNPPAVIRLCKRAGLSGYRELQILLTMDLYATRERAPEETQALFELGTGQSVDAIARAVVSRTTDAVERVLSLLSAGAVEQAAAAILGARSVAVFGIGVSASVAYELYQKLSVVGVPCSFAFDPDAQLGIAGGMGPEDAALIVSSSCESSLAVAVVEEAKRSGARLIGITGVGQSALSRLADVVLHVPATEPLMRVSASLTMTSLLVVVDILYATVICRSADVSIPRLARNLELIHGQELQSAERG